PHVRDDALLPAAEGEDADDDHLAVLDGQLLALADRQRAQGRAGADVLGILTRDPVPERVAVGTGALPVDLLRLGGGRACGHCRLLTCRDRAPDILSQDALTRRRFAVYRGGPWATS